MRIGLITTLLWNRWGPFWTSLIGDAGHEVVRAGPDAVRRARAELNDARPPGLAFELAAAEARALADCELIVAPDLNPGLAGGDAGGRGGGQDPWIADFPATLARAVPGLPPVRPVPASLDAPLETLAIELLLPLNRDAVGVRRAWERNRATARPPRAPGVRWQVRPSQLRAVGVVGQPWLLGDALVAALGSDDEHLVAQHRLEPAELRDEGRRADPDLIDTDAEAIGAARLFARRGSVRAIRVLVDERSGSDGWLLRRVEALARKPVERVRLDEVAGGDPAALLRAG